MILLDANSASVLDVELRAFALGIRYTSFLFIYVIATQNHFFSSSEMRLFFVDECQKQPIISRNLRQSRSGTSGYDRTEMLSGIQPYCPAGEETAAEASRVYVPSRESIAIC